MDTPQRERHVARGPKVHSLYPLYITLREGGLFLVDIPVSSLWHGRLGHLSKAGIMHLSKAGYIPKLSFSDHQFCEHCRESDEFKSDEFVKFCRERGIRREYTTPYSPEQNEIAERMNRTIQERVVSMLQHSGLTDGFWAEALLTTVDIINMSPSRPLGLKIP